MDIDAGYAQAIALERFPLRFAAGIGRHLMDPALQVRFRRTALPGTEVEDCQLGWAAGAGNRRLRDTHAGARSDLLPARRQCGAEAGKLDDSAARHLGSAAAAGRKKQTDQQQLGRVLCPIRCARISPEWAGDLDFSTVL